MTGTQRVTRSEPRSDVVEPRSTAVSRDSILRPGENCWRVERAERFRCVQDGQEYFRLVRDALLSAKRTVFVLGWDIYADVDLRPEGVDDGAPTKLAELLDFVVRRTPELEIYVLVWDYAALYALERDPTSRIRLGWKTHERVHFAYDDLHPVGGSHHQKVVVVDDRLAFSGGLDLTSHRWDTSAHPCDHALRLSVKGEPYTPFHDIQALVEGPVAASLGELARARWTRRGVAGLPPIEPRTESLWPADDPPDLFDVDVAIARTEPQFRSAPAVLECGQLFHDQIAAARRVIYIENQYFTNAAVGEAIGKRLREPDGPEVVFVGPRECSGWLEQKTMGALRHSVLVHLVESDLHGRLRLLYPVASADQDVCTFVHSKILVIDDDHLRIGSANLSSRSMGVDTECDLVAISRGDAEMRSGIRRVRDRMVGEHLGLSAEAVGAAVDEHGSLGKAIDALAGGEHTLARVVVDTEERPETWDAIRFVIDPEQPMMLSRAVDRLLPDLDIDDSRKLSRALFVAACTAGIVAITARGTLGALGLESASGHEFLVGLAANEGAVRWIFAGLVAAGLLFLPFELLVLLPVVLLGTLRGGAIAIAAGAVCGAVGYAIGRLLGPKRITPLLSRRSTRIWKGLRRYGALSVAVAHFTALFSATTIHVLCGAARVGVRDYLLGTMLGLAPALVTSLALGALLRGALLDPSPWRTVATIVAAIVFAIVVLRFRRIVNMRTHGTVTREHRARARYG